MKKLGVIAAALLSALLFWLFLPTLAYDFADFWVFVIFCAVIFTAVMMITSYDGVVYLPKIPIGVLGSSACVLLLLSIGSCSMFRAGDYQQQIGSVETRTLGQSLSPVDPAHIRIVDRGTAERIADKLIGEDLALGSRAELGELHIQKFGRDVYWVAPILHSGFFAWWNFSEGTPGYIMVSATNPADARFVRTLGRAEVQIRYQPGAYFGQNLERHVYMNGYATTGTTQYAFEIDDAGKPFWIVTLYRHTIGISGAEAYGVLTVDAQSGSITEYTITNAPAWIDRIQPDSFIDSQIDNWGYYINGWLNPSNSGRLQASEEVEMVYGEDVRMYWYAGLTSVGADESIVGFMLVDSRTKEAHRFNQPGATEFAAQSSMQGKVSSTRYVASSLIPYNIGGHPTYVGALKDEAGLIKMVGMVSVADHTVVGVGQDVQSALADYQNALASNGNSIAPDASVRQVSVRGVIARISSDTHGGNTTYYLTLSERPSYVFSGASSLSTELVLSRAGDTVSLQYLDGPNNPVTMRSFDNAALSDRVSAAQAAVTARADAVRNQESVSANARDADSRWETMSDEEKARTLEPAN